MKVDSKVGVIWMIVVIAVIGAVFVLITMLQGGDESDQEQQPENSAPFSASSHLAHLSAEATDGVLGR